MLIMHDNWNIVHTPLVCGSHHNNYYSEYILVWVELNVNGITQAVKSHSVCCTCSCLAVSVVGVVL